MKTHSDELVTFVAIVESGGISLAAQQLGQNPSSISRTLARLEEKLGVTLLKRTTRSQDLTEEGMFFLERARRILKEIEEAEDLLYECNRQPAGRLRVDSASVVLQHCVVPYLPEFTDRYPQIDLELSSSETVIDLLEQRTDVALRLGHLADSSLTARLLGRSLRRVLASPGYLARHGEPASVEELALHRTLGFTRPARLNQWPLKSSRGELWQTTPAVKASNGEFLRQLALRHEGIVCLSDFMTRDDRREGRLVQILEDQTLPEIQPLHAVYYRHTSLASRIQVFIEFLTEKLQGQEGALGPPAEFPGQ